MNGHGPFIAPIIELDFFFDNCVADSRLGEICVNSDASNQDGGSTTLGETNLFETLSKY